VKHEQYKLTLKPGQSIKDIEKMVDEIKCACWADEVQISGFGRHVYVDIYKGKMRTDIPYQIPEQDPKGLTVPIGYDMKGELITLNMKSDNHTYVLYAGFQGTGKSTALNGIIRAVVNYPPEWVRLVLIDLKMGNEFREWFDWPHCWLKATDPEKPELKHTLTMLNAEVRKRYKLFEQYRVKDIDGYREKVGPMNYIFLVIDEYAELSSAADGEEMQKLLKRTLGIGRAAGLRCILSTLRPVADLINTTIKALFPDRIALRVATALESRIILDTNGAEELEEVQGRGILLSGAKYRKIQTMHYIEGKDYGSM